SLTHTHSHTLPALRNHGRRDKPHSPFDPARARHLLDFTHERMSHQPATFHSRFLTFSRAREDKVFIWFFCKWLLLGLRSHRKELQVLVRV
ncbi:MAG: hypothetical protein ACK56I_00110, partial [bacterium]